MKLISHIQFLIANVTFSPFILAIYFFLLAFFYFPTVAFAQSSVSIASDSGKTLTKPIQVLGDQATAEGVLTSSVDQKLEDLKKEIASKAAELKGEVNKKIGNKAVLGKATTISSDTITLGTKNGSRTIKMNEYTLFQDSSKQKAKKAFTKDQINTNDTLVCLGDMDEKGVMVAKKIVRIDPPTNEPQNSYRYGQIGTVTNLSFILELRNVPNPLTSTINFVGTTLVQNGKDDGSITDIKQGRSAIVIGSQKDTTVQASFIYLLPITGMLKPITSLNQESTNTKATSH